MHCLRTTIRWMTTDQILAIDKFLQLISFLSCSEGLQSYCLSVTFITEAGLWNRLDVGHVFDARECETKETIDHCAY